MGASAPLSLLYFVFIVYVLCISPVEYWNQINLELLHAARCTNLTLTLFFHCQLVRGWHSAQSSLDHCIIISSHNSHNYDTSLIVTIIHTSCGTDWNAILTFKPANYSGNLKTGTSLLHRPPGGGLLQVAHACA